MYFVYLTSSMILASVFFALVYSVFAYMKEDFLKKVRIEGREVNERYGIDQGELSHADRQRIQEEWFHAVSE